MVFSPQIKKATHYNKFVLTWILVFLVSTISYHLVGEPWQRLSTYVGKWIKDKDAEATGFEI